MTTVKFSYEGGTNGSNVAAGAGASTGDTNFDVANIGSGATNQYDNTHPGRGSLGVKFATGATSATSYDSWTTTIGTQTTIFIRALCYFTAAAAANHRICQILSSSTTRAAITFNTAGKLVFQNAAVGTVLTSNAVPLNSTFRLEAKLVLSATVGQWEYKIWNDPRDVGTPNDTQTSAASQNTGGSADTYRLGLAVAISNAGPFWLDDVAISTVDYVGPEDPRVTGTATVNAKKASIAATGAPLLANIRATSHYASSATESSFTMTLPTGWQAGDEVFIGVALAAATGTINTPTGYSAGIASQHSNSSTSATHAVFKRTMQAGDSNPSISGTSGRFSAVAVAIRNFDTTTLLDATSIFDGNTGISYPNLELPSISPVNSNDLLLAFAAVRNGTNNATTTFAAPSDIAVYDQATSGVGAVSNSAIALLSSHLTNNSATGTKTVTLTSSSGTSVNQMSSVLLIRTYTVSISGGPTIKKMGVSVSITETTAISGGPTLKKMRVSASITETATISGGPHLKKMRVSASITETTAISGGPRLKKIIVAGSITATTAISGSPHLKKMRIAASITETTTISCSPHLKKMRIAATINETTTISAGPHLKKIRVSAGFEKITYLSGGPHLKKMRVSASITETATISGGPHLKKMRVSASITETATISGGPTLKRIRVSGILTETTVLSGGPVIKKIHVHVNAVRPHASELMVFTPV